MLTKDECFSILVSLEDKGINIDIPMQKLAISREVPTDVLKFIAKNQGIEVGNFYEFLRKRGNQKGTPLYKNLLTGTDSAIDGAVMLSSLLTQIMLHVKKVPDDSEKFLRDVRATEIANVISGFADGDDFENGFKLLKLIKTDLMVLEYLEGKREIE